MCLEPTNTLEALKEPGRHPCSLHTGNSFQGHKYYFNTWFPAMPLSNTDPSTPCPCRGKGIYDGPPPQRRTAVLLPDPCPSLRRVPAGAANSSSTICSLQKKDPPSSSKPSLGWQGGCPAQDPPPVLECGCPQTPLGNSMSPAHKLHLGSPAPQGKTGL